MNGTTRGRRGPGAAARRAGTALLGAALIAACTPAAVTTPEGAPGPGTESAVPGVDDTGPTGTASPAGAAPGGGSGSSPGATVEAPSTPAVPGTAPPAELSGVPADAEGPYRVLEVFDGDTIRVNRPFVSETVRLLGIDAPETDARRGPIECFGPESSRHAREMLRGAAVYLRTDPTQDERDRFDRLLAYVWRDDGTFANYRMVADGYAFEYTYDSPYRFRAEFRAAQDDARLAGRGLWAPGACADGPVGPPPVAAAGLEAAAAGRSGTGSDGEGVVIAFVHYDGDLPEEPDEYAEVVNRGTAAVDLAGWRLVAGDDEQVFAFPALALGPGDRCRVYTGKVHPEWCGLSFGSAKPLWRNKGECGQLFDTVGTLVSERCY